MQDYITKEEFTEWLHSRTTQKIVFQIREKVKELRIQLAERAGLDSARDRYDAGLTTGMEYIANLQDLFDWPEQGERE